MTSLARETMLSTVDNEYNPFEDFDLWYNRDLELGYNSCCVLDRFAKTSDQLSEADYLLEIERAIDDIISHDMTKRFIKVVKENKT